MKDRIKTVRKDNGLTQTEFGDRIGATRPMIASYEGGAVVPSDTTLKLISKEFNVSYAWLKTGEGPMIDPALSEQNAEKMKRLYQNLPDRLMTLIDILIEKDPDWFNTLQAALDELDRRKKEGNPD